MTFEIRCTIDNTISPFDEPSMKPAQNSTSNVYTCNNTTDIMEIISIKT